MNDFSHNRFTDLLARRRRVWVNGLLAGSLFRLTGIFLAGWTLLAAFDALLALPAAARWTLALGWTGFYVGALVWALTRHRSRTAADFARYADRAAGARHPILSSFQAAEDLTRETVSPFKRYLSETLLEEGTHSLKHHPEQRVANTPSARSGLKFLAGCAGGVALVSLVFLSILSATYPRVLFPWQDNPPYSPYRFTVHLPEEPVYYGDTAELTVEVHGPPLREQVVLRMRGPSGESQRVCFQESQRRFVQEVENLTGEMEVAFATGRARTRWLTVPVRYEPRILAARLHAAPPAYTGQPVTDVLLREDTVRGHSGTEFTLSIASNRPLAGGRLEFIEDNGTAPRTVEADILEGTSARFRWTLDTDAELEVVLEDLRGSRNREPFRLTQEKLEDRPPEIALTEPPAYSLATPSTRLNLQGYARDDLGLSRVDLWQGLGRFRDRSRHLGPDEPIPSLDISHQIDLARLGAEPGNVLEFYAQASDTNPEGSAVTSNLVRVEIIDEETYAEFLRRELTIRDFVRRMEETHVALEAVTEAIDALREARDAGADAAELEALRERLAETMDSARNTMDTLADDFPAFDIESSAAAVWRETADTLGAQMETLTGLDLSSSEADEALAAMRERWAGPDADDLDRLREDSETLAHVHELMALAARLSAVVEAQREITRHMDREVNRAGGVAAEAVRGLGEDQETIRRELETVANAIKDAVDALPDSPRYYSLRESAMEVTTLIYALQIPVDMEDAVQAGRAVQPDDMLAHANRALENLETLLEDCSGGAFGGMCEGNLNFSLPNLDQTLAQMLASLLGAPGMGGPGQGRGFGIGGGRGAGMGGEGAWMSGPGSPLGVPVYGPQRSGFSPAREGLAFQDHGASGSGGPGDPGSGGGSVRVEGGAPVTAEATEVDPRDSFLLQRVPDRYRDAARRYFQNLEDHEFEPR